MNKGFVSLTILAIIGTVAILSSGGVYGIYKYQQVAKENSALKERVEAQKDDRFDQALEQVRLFVEQDVENESTHKKTVPLVTYYVKPTKANVRPCATKYNDDRCAPIGQYEQNDEIELPYLNIESMPEWISVDWNGDEALINKIVLSQKPIVAPAPAPPPQEQLDDDQRTAELTKFIEDLTAEQTQQKSSLSSFTDCLNLATESGIMLSSPVFNSFMSGCTGKEYGTTSPPPSATYTPPGSNRDNTSTFESISDVRDKQKQENFDRTVCEKSGGIYFSGSCI